MSTTPPARPIRRGRPGGDPGLGRRAGGRPGRRPVRALVRQPDQPACTTPRRAGPGRPQEPHDDRLTACSPRSGSRACRTPGPGSLLIAAGAGFLAWTYRGIYLRTGRRLIWWLLLLRAAGLLALVLALAKPTWTRENDLVDPGRVAVVLDNSASMSLADPSRAVPVRAGDRRPSTGSGRPSRGTDRARASRWTSSTSTAPRSPRREARRRADRPGPRPSTRRSPGSAPGRSRRWSSSATATTTPAAPTSASWPTSPVPVHTVGFAPTRKAGGLDLAVRSAQAPARAMVHNQIKVDVTVTKTGGPATDADCHPSSAAASRSPSQPCRSPRATPSRPSA